MSPRLTDALSVMLPSPQHTAFLKTCLLAGGALAPAWREWLGAVGDPVRFLRERGQTLRSHLPLLYRNLAEHGEAVPPVLQSHLRAAVVREELRFATYDECFHDALRILTAACIDVTVLKGAALARTVFTPPSLRHCHDLDVWVPERDVPPAVSALAAHGYALAARPGTTTRVRHAKGLPVSLHTQLVAGPYCGMPVDEMRERRTVVDGASGAWRALAPPDMLAHVLAHASTASRRPHANWVVDAHRVGTRLTARDWETFADVVARAELALPVAVLLRYLAGALAVPVPTTVLDQLDAAADRIGGAALVAAIDGAWLGRPGGIRAMFARSGWRSRIAVARCLLAPPPQYLRALRGPMGRARLAVEYPVRPLRLVVRAVRRRTAHTWSGERSPALPGGAGEPA